MFNLWLIFTMKLNIMTWKDKHLLQKNTFFFFECTYFMYTSSTPCVRYLRTPLQFVINRRWSSVMLGEIHQILTTFRFYTNQGHWHSRLKSDTWNKNSKQLSSHWWTTEATETTSLQYNVIFIFVQRARSVIRHQVMICKKSPVITPRSDARYLVNYYYFSKHNDCKKMGTLTWCNG